MVIPGIMCGVYLLPFSFNNGLIPWGNSSRIQETLTIQIQIGVMTKSHPHKDCKLL